MLSPRLESLFQRQTDYLAQDLIVGMLLAGGVVAGFLSLLG
jgi:hypothetical protein